MQTERAGFTVSTYRFPNTGLYLQQRVSHALAFLYTILKLPEQPHSKMETMTTKSSFFLKGEVTVTPQAPP